MVVELVPHPSKREASDLPCKVWCHVWLELEAPLAIGGSWGTHCNVQRSTLPQMLCRMVKVALCSGFVVLATCASFAVLAAFAATAFFACEDAGLLLQISGRHQPNHLVFVGAVPGLLMVRVRGHIIR